MSEYKRIILKKSSVPGKLPTAEQLEIGELAVNLNDAILYTKDGSDNIKSIKDPDAARKVQGASEENSGNFASFDAAGEVTDSEYAPEDFEPADATILKQANVVNALDSTSTTDPLSAAQGKALNEVKVDKVEDHSLVADTEIAKIHTQNTDTGTSSETFETARSATPALLLKDADCTDSDVNFQISIDATDTGSGTEDVDVSMETQVNGSLVEILKFTAATEILELGPSGKVLELDESKKVSDKTDKLFSESTKITSATLAAADCRGQVYNNYNQAADVTMKLPPAAAGMSVGFRMVSTAAFYYRVDPDDSDKHYFDGLALDDGYYVGVAAAAPSQEIWCYAMQTGAATYDWQTLTVSGPWLGQA